MPYKKAKIKPLFQSGRLAGQAAALTWSLYCLSIFSAPASAWEGNFASAGNQLHDPVLPAVQSKLADSIINTEETTGLVRQQAASAVETEDTELQKKAQISEASDSKSADILRPAMLNEPTAIAQSVSRPDDIQQLDLTPIKIPERAAAFSTIDSYKARMLYKLPARMFFSGTCENSLRLETNVFQTSRNPQADAVYRVLPNLTVGYAMTRRTRVSSNFFMFRDQYASRDSQLSRNIYSVGVRADHDFTINDKTTVTTGLFCRELFFNLQNSGTPPLSDIIPSAVIVRRVGQHGAAYGSVMGQVRFQKMLDRFQEFDQFYSVGYIHRKSPWVMTADCTFLTNFGNSNLRGGNNNQVFVLTGEVARQLHRNIPVAAFVRAEPIFNMGANSSPGLAGFNFRLYGGLRAEISKPAIFPTKLASK